MASALDGDNKILPIGFFVVEVENNENWGYFMRRLREVVCPDRSDICIVSDRQGGILTAMRSENWEMALHRFCIRHLSSNYNKHFKNAAIKKFITNAAYQSQQRKFDEMMDSLEKNQPDSYEWIKSIPKEKWSLAYDGGARWGSMTTNVAESVNGILKDVRGMPITTMIEMIYFRLVVFEII